MKPHGPWRIKKTNDAYRDDYLHVWVDDVIRPDGRDGTHVVARMKPGVCVLPLDDQNVCHLTREFHYGIGRISLEGVSGGIESGEDALTTAQRELREEMGIEAARWEYLATVDPFTTIVVSPTRLYIARDLTFGAAAPEGTEQIERFAVPLDQAVAMIERGEITHAPTCVLVLHAALKS